MSGKSFRSSRCVFVSSRLMMCVTNFGLEMKLVIAAIYTNYVTEIVDDEGMEQADTFIAGPVGGKLVLRFKRV